MPSRLTRILLLISVLFTMFRVPSTWADETVSSEYLVKAAFLYNFAKFVDWPEGSFHHDDSPLTILVYGENPFGEAFGSLKGKTVKGRKLIIKHYSGLIDLERCHIMFISSSEEKYVPSIIKKIKGKNILSVADMDGFAQRGGMINLIKTADRLRIEINAGAAELAGMSISSKLLNLDDIVNTSAEEGN